MGHIRDLVFYKAYSDIKAEASRAYLGYVWWILEPLLYVVILFVVFGLGLRRGDKQFVVFLLIGIAAWKWFQSNITGAGRVLDANKGLLQQVYVPKYIFPFVLILSTTFKFFILLLLVIGALFITDYSPSFPWLALPLIIAIQFLFILGISTLVTAIVPFIPDLQPLITSLLTMLFLMSGIFFDIGKLSEPLRHYFRLNPMASLIENYRLVLLFGLWPNWKTLAWILFVSLILIIASFSLLSRFDRLYPRILS